MLSGSQPITPPGLAGAIRLWLVAGGRGLTRFAVAPTDRAEGR